MNETKKRKIIIIRHGEPDFPDEHARCVSRTDYMLTDFGIHEAHNVGKWLESEQLGNVSIYCSPLTRCRQTAEIICSEMKINSADIIVKDELIEISCGIWENMTFEDIFAQHPVEARERQKNFAGYRIPGGETFYEAGERFEKALVEIQKENDGNIIIVAHAGLLRGLLLNRGIIEPEELFNIHLPYAGITELEDNGNLSVERYGYKPMSFLDDDAINWMYKKCHVPEHIIKHMQAVASYQNSLLDELEKTGRHYDRDCLEKAAKLHDIKRIGKHHAAEGAKYLYLQGCTEVAELVANHHSAESSSNELSEADILFYADKRVKEDRIVSVEERFSASRQKCTTSEGLAKHTAIFNRAKCIEEKLISYGVNVNV